MKQFRIIFACLVFVGIAVASGSAVAGSDTNRSADGASSS